MLDDLTSTIRQIGERLGDWRTQIFDVQPSYLPATRQLVLEGELLERAQLDALLAQLRAASPQLQIISHLRLLAEGDDYGWALVRWPVLNLRRAASPEAELLSQSSLGEAVELLRLEDDWAFVRLRDGYLGWAQRRGLSACSRAEALGYRANATHVIVRPFATCYDQQRRHVALLPFGLPLPLLKQRAGLCLLETPWGEPWLIDPQALAPLEALAAPGASGFQALLPQLRQLLGIPYLWGGTSAFGYDCSGLVQSAYRLLGIPLQRDADMQSLAGQPAEGPTAPGDLIFFTNQSSEAAEREQHITHVGIALADAQLLHANQRYWAVTINSLLPDRPDSYAELNDLVVVVRRFWEQ